MELPSDQSADNHGLLAPAVKVGIMVASVGVASSLGFFLHPHLLPFLSDVVPELWGAAQRWLTAPTLFLLFNVVVGSLYFSYSLFSRPDKVQEIQLRADPAAVSSSARTATDNQLQERDAAAAQANAQRPGGGLRARMEKSRTFSRLVRSKSEQIAPSMTTSKVEASGSAGRLKKAGTFEAAAQGLSRKPMVIVADPPELDESSGLALQGQEQEVDKKAEDFISRFYQRVKLQRLDSLLRSQQAST